MNFVPLYMMRWDKNREKPVPHSMLFRHEKLCKTLQRARKSFSKLSSVSAWVKPSHWRIFTEISLWSLVERRVLDTTHPLVLVGTLRTRIFMLSQKKQRKTLREKFNSTLSGKLCNTKKQLFSRFSSFLLFFLATPKKEWAERTRMFDSNKNIAYRANAQSENSHSIHQSLFRIWFDYMLNISSLFLSRVCGAENKKEKYYKYI